MLYVDSARQDVSMASKLKDDDVFWARSGSCLDRAIRIEKVGPGKVKPETSCLNSDIKSSNIECECHTELVRSSSVTLSDMSSSAAIMSIRTDLAVIRTF